ncbi:uncharacterized protein LOC110034515, partial [Phalaenopsis equestris]|uniref:uncharacterized protein LOC110034515 n=1 Tax=Phalaenopsis equestris TaxID=78828 RepID=UPI0009E36382
MMEEIFVSDAGNRVEEGLMEDSSSASRNLEQELEKDEFQIDMKEEKKELPGTRVQGRLKQEIIQLKKRLNDQLAVRRALEKALGYRTTAIDSSLNDSFIPMPAQELIREISVLELEVRHLEHYLLSLYRSAFDRQTPMVSPSMPPRERSKGPISCQRMLFQAPKAELSPKQTAAVKSTRILPSQLSANKLVDEPCCENFACPKFHRSHSALNHRAAYSTRLSSSEEPLATALHECQDQPFSALKDGHGSASSVISLAECLGTSIADHVPETPNKVSEDMVRCMGAIYSKLADPPPVIHDPASSRTSSLSSMS